MSSESLKKTVLIVSVFSSFLFPFMGSAVNVAIPAIGKDFNAGAVQLSWIATALLLSAAIFLVPIGRLADIFGRKRFFSFGIGLFIFSSLLAGLSPSLSVLLVARVFQGMGGAMIAGTSMAILTSVFPPGERGKAIGINTSAVYLGLASGPFLGGLLTSFLGWRSLFFVNIPVGLLVLFLLFHNIKGEWKGAEGERVDLPGSLLYAVMLVSLISGFTLLPGLWAFILLAGGMIFFLFFLKRETSFESPVLQLNLFKHNKVFAFSNIAALLNYSATFSVSFLMSLYLQYVKGYAPHVAGSVLVTQPIVQSIFSPISGILSDHVEPRVIASWGMGLTVAGLIILSFLQPDSAMILIIGILILLGFGFALFSSPNMNAIMSSVGKRHLGVASAMVATMRTIGQTFSMGATAMFFSIFLGGGKLIASPEKIPPFMLSMKFIFVFSALLCLFGIFASLARGDMRKQRYSSGSRDSSQKS